ncbi:hypothetical protein ACP70R_047740 [Stipagrostis hirtigluma subsp. patula]
MATTAARGSTAGRSLPAIVVPRDGGNLRLRLFKYASCFVSWSLSKRIQTYYEI